MAVHYICDGCTKRIFPVTARFHCLVCADYDSCQTCHLGGRFSHPHEAAHPFHIIYVPSESAPTLQPVITTVVANTIPPPPPPPPLPLTAPPTTVSVPLPPPPPAPPAATSAPPPLRFTPTQPPPLPPRKLPPRAPSTGTTPDQYWGSLITPNSTASPLLSRLADATFTHFASTTQALTPEQLSTFYTSMNRTGAQNFPQLFQSLMAQYDATLDPADEQIAFVFREYGYEHVMTTRAPVEGHKPVINGMPLLMREGFQKMLLDEVLEAPEEAYIGFNALLRNIPILVDPLNGTMFEHKEIPRVCFPADSDPVVRAKGDRISAALMQRSEAMFEDLANAVKRRETAAAELKRQEEELEAEAAARERLAAVKARIAMEQYGQDNILGGWRVDSFGDRYYDAGLI